MMLIQTVLSLSCIFAAAQPAVPPLHGFDVALLDTTTTPCVDFYQYACGGWLAANSIPPDQSRWGRFSELIEHNRAELRDILEAASAPDPKRDAVDQKIGDYYASCMDEQGIEALGLSPLKPELGRIAAIADPAGLQAEIARLHESGVAAVFEFGSAQDYKDASRMIAAADQGGLGLPDRDYYLKTDEKSVEQRADYAAHVRKMLGLLGEEEKAAAADAEKILAFETKLAAASQDLVSRRDPANLYHKMTLAEFSAAAPAFSWNRYLADIDAPRFTSLNVASPEFFKAASALVSSEPLETWKAYLRWHLVHAQAPLLPKAFVDENFDFYGRKLAGAQELKARWKRCVEMADRDLGEALGRRYVEKAFSAHAKERTLAMVGELEKALAADLSSAPWMTAPTRERAVEKLRAIANKIGYPDRWRDYSSYQVVRGDAAGNQARGRRFEFRRELAKIGKPVDRKEWEMTPPTVNAYYDPQMNDINFPAGILQPPFFEDSMDDAVNFGAIGAVIGHELTHGFDDEGRHFDAKGDLRDWWTKEDAREFEKRSACFVDEYGSFVATGDLKLNGKLTLGENTADNGGLRLASMALGEALAKAPARPIDGFTPEQRLFLAWGQIWCQKYTPQTERLMALTNPHSPGRYRVNGVLVNMPEFQKTWSCAAGQPMVSPKPCRVW